MCFYHIHPPTTILPRPSNPTQIYALIYFFISRPICAMQYTSLHVATLRENCLSPPRS